MGGSGLRDEPSLEKIIENGVGAFFKFGVCSMEGWRTSNEDAHVAQQIELPGGDKGGLFCVWDGHGGDYVSEYCKKYFY